MAVCRVYNNHIFVDHADTRLGTDSDLNWDDGAGYTMQATNTPYFFYSGPDAVVNGSGGAVKPMHFSTTLQRSTQSLPDFDSPCQRIWDRYFAPNATVNTWFTGNHSVDREIFIRDCNSTVVLWRAGMRQIRYASCTLNTDMQYKMFN